jgi:cysteine synthase B
VAVWQSSQYDASALERGDIKKGDKLIEATSGKWIALAMIAQLIMNMKLIPEDSTKERTQTMAYATVTLHRPRKEGSRPADKKGLRGGYIESVCQWRQLESTL